MFFSPKFAIRQTRWEMKDGVVLEDARNMLPSIRCWFKTLQACNHDYRWWRWNARTSWNVSSPRNQGINYQAQQVTSWLDRHQPDGIPNHLGPTVMTGLGDVVQGANVELLWSTGVAWPCLVWVYWVYLGAVVMSRTSWEVWMFSFFRHSTELWLQVARDFMAGMTCDSCHTALRRELLLLWRELGASWGEVAQEVCLGEMSKDGNWNGPGQIQEFREKRWTTSLGE